MARKNATRQPVAEGVALGAGLFVARDTHYYKGTILVSAGDTVEAGHPMLKGREHLFRPFVVTFPVNGPQPLPVASAPEPEPEPEPEAAAAAEPEPESE